MIDVPDTLDPIPGEHLGIRFEIFPCTLRLHPSWDVVRWRLFLPEWGRIRKHESPGAFYGGIEDHPEGAIEWAIWGAKRTIDKMAGVVP